MGIEFSIVQMDPRETRDEGEIIRAVRADVKRTAICVCNVEEIV